MQDRPLLDPLDRWLLIALVGPLYIGLAYMRFKLVGSLDPAPDLVTTLGVLRGHLFGYLAGLLLCAAVLATARGSRIAFVVRALLLFWLALVTFVDIAAFSLYRTSHTVLDASLLLYAVGNIREMLVVLATVQNPVVYALVMLGIVAVLAAGLKIVERFIPGEAGPLNPRGVAGLWGASLVLVALSAWRPSPEVLQRSFGRAVPVNLVLTAYTQKFEGLPALPPDYPTPELTTHPARRPNLVVIGLESTRSMSTTVYDPKVQTTPKLAELAEQSLVVERGYANFGHTTKAWVGIWCSHAPIPTMTVHESDPGGLPVKCLPDLLEDYGYASVFFHSATERFEGKPQLAQNLGFDTFFAAEDLDTEGYERANYFGWEDAILLPPSEKWLLENADQPFVAFYMTGTPHHDYLAPANRYGRSELDPDPTRNLYLNAVAYLDHFVDELLDQYKRLGLYEDTVFLLVGDHGEGLGEHFKKFHNDCMYEECVRVPFIVHAPGRVEPGRRDLRADQLDVVPTALDAMGFGIQGVTGRSVLADEVPERTTFISCWYDRQCIASVRDRKKLIHFFDDVPDALYDLTNDPEERHDLHAEQPDYVAERRKELLDWYAETKGRYWSFRDF